MYRSRKPAPEVPATWRITLVNGRFKLRPVVAS